MQCKTNRHDVFLISLNFVIDKLRMNATKGMKFK